LHSVKLVRASDGPLPPNAVSGTNWHVVTLWQKEAGDEVERFQQRITITDPLGTARFQMLTEFELPKEFHRNIGRINGFPVSPEGDYTVEVSVRNLKEDTWRHGSSFPLRVAFHKAESPKVSSPETTH
jgi:hypothetical protein